MKNRCDGCAGGGWLRRTIQLRRHLVASRLGNDCHTSTKKSSLSLKTRVNKKHLRQRCWWWCRQSHDRVTSKRFDKRSTTILPRGKTKQEHRETKRGTLDCHILSCCWLMFTEARSNPDEQKYIVGAEIVSFAPKLVEIGGESRSNRRLCTHLFNGRSQRNTNTLTHHQTFASKTYVMINTVILSSIFDYL